jgi:hypothetical protein
MTVIHATVIPILSGPTTRKETHGRRRAGDPVETIHDGEYGQAVDRHVESERQIQEREAAKSIIGAQQEPVVPSVAEPAREGAAKEGEDAGRCEQPGPGDLAQPMIDAGGYEMRPDEAVCRGSAYEIPTGNQPEVA